MPDERGIHLHVGLGLLWKINVLNSHAHTHTHTHKHKFTLTSTDDDIFSTPAKAPPKKKKQWMDDFLDDDKDLFGNLKTDEDSKPVASAPSKTVEREAKAKSGGLFDDFALDDPEDKAADVNGHKGTIIVCTQQLAWPKLMKVV